jgi:hypothetical protein
MKIIYNPVELDQAALYLVQHNKESVGDYDDCVNKIKSTITKMINAGNTILSTLGFVIWIDYIGEDTAQADIYVSPAIGRYHSVEIDLEDF